MTKGVDEDEKLLQTILGAGQQQRKVLMITEEGLYEVLFQSRKPIARAFKKEVKRILKELRNHGFTATPAAIEEMINNPDLIIRLATELKSEREAKEKEKLRADLNEHTACLANSVIRKNAPKVEYYEDVLLSNSDFTSTVMAKELGLRSAIELHKRLHARGIMYKLDNTWLLYAKYCGFDYTKTRTHTFTDGRGDNRTEQITTWTETGRKFLHGLNL